MRESAQRTLNMHSCHTTRVTIQVNAMITDSLLALLPHPVVMIDGTEEGGLVL